MPSELGGGGVTSVHDVLVASSRLARGDPATTIGVNMHFAVLINLVRSWRSAVERDDGLRAAGIGRTPAGRGGGGRRVRRRSQRTLAAGPHPPVDDRTRAGDGWVINGRKAFATMAPAATILNVAVSYVDARGRDRYGFALVPRTSPGVVFHDDWDALGMRASASGSVSFEDVRIGADSLRDGFPAGEYSTPLLDRYLAAGAFHAAASLGIAEAAHAGIVTTLRRRVDSALADPHAVTELAANVVDLAAMRASFDRAGHLIDEYVDAHLVGPATLDEAQSVYGEVQACKAFLTAAAVRVVDRAMALERRRRLPRPSTHWPRPGGTSGPAASCTPSAPIGPTSCSPGRRSAWRPTSSRCVTARASASSTAASPSSVAPSASAAA